jgi:hypothetical protein
MSPFESSRRREDLSPVPLKANLPEAPLLKTLDLRDMGLFANVRKKRGRPTVWARCPQGLDIFGPDSERTYRAGYERMRLVNIWGELASAVGEEDHMSESYSRRLTQQPKLIARWPWLFGNPMQKTVLLQMHEYPKENMLQVADQLERLHRDKNLNAKTAIRMVRGFKLRVKRGQL